MGGQNHQPTNRVRLIAPSAWLSQRVGEGFASVLHANSDLEDAIIVGMDNLHVEALVPSTMPSAREALSRAIAKLQASLKIVAEIQLAYAHLLKAAERENYQGNPLASKIREYNLPETFSGTLVIPEVNMAAWRAVEDRIGALNILRTLDWEAGQFADLIVPTGELIQVLNVCAEIENRSGARKMVEAIECNEVGLRQSFSKVFSLWNYLHEMFLYSALQMTELFYITNDFGTLLRDPHERPIGRITA